MHVIKFNAEKKKRREIDTESSRILSFYACPHNLPILSPQKPVNPDRLTI